MLVILTYAVMASAIPTPGQVLLSDFRLPTSRWGATSDHPDKEEEKKLEEDAEAAKKKLGHKVPPKEPNKKNKKSSDKKEQTKDGHSHPSYSKEEGVERYNTNESGSGVERYGNRSKQPSGVDRYSSKGYPPGRLPSHLWPKIGGRARPYYLTWGAVDTGFAVLGGGGAISMLFSTLGILVYRHDVKTLSPHQWQKKYKNTAQSGAWYLRNIAIITGTVSGLLAVGSVLFGWRSAENYATANELKEQERALYREMFPPGGEVRRHSGD